MTLLEIVLTILTALFTGLIFCSVFKSTGHWGTFCSFLLIFILAGLAAKTWITPVGPAIWGFSWIPTLLVIIIVSLLLAAAIPGPHPRKRELNLVEKLSPRMKKRQPLQLTVLLDFTDYPCRFGYFKILGLKEQFETRYIFN